MTRQCLIIIDLLNDYLDRWNPDRKAELLANTNRIVSAFRARNLPIIWVRQEFRADLNDAFLEMRDKGILLCIEGTRGAQLHPDLDWKAEDVTLVKKRYSAFFGTGLDDLLEQLSAGEVILCGINTHACIRMTAIDAYQRDLRVMLALDSIDSYDDLHAEVSLGYMRDKVAKTASTDEIIRNIDLKTSLA